jgi:hypothetical protein
MERGLNHDEIPKEKERARERDSERGRRERRRNVWWGVVTVADWSQGTRRECALTPAFGWGARRRFIQSKKRRMRWTLGATRRRREGGPDKAIATGRWMSLPTQASPSSPVETSSNDISFL